MSKDFSMLTISRHRIKTDGRGITSLVALAGCPLSCPYCINQELLKDAKQLKTISCEKLIEELSIDHCYFLYTGGGVTFGGGEPLLQADTLMEFAQICPPEWSINLETSLNVPFSKLEPLLNGRFSFIIDIKAMQPDIYKSYTGLDNDRVLDNLSKLCKYLSTDQYVIKVPQIPGYSDEAAVEESVRILAEMGVPEENIMKFRYIIP